MGENGTIALAAALKATAVTCGHEFPEDALVWSSPIKLKHVMRVFNCFSCCFMCLKGTAHQDVRHRCAAPMYLVNVARATTNRVEFSTDYAWDPDFFFLACVTSHCVSGRCGDVAVRRLWP